MYVFVNDFVEGIDYDVYKVCFDFMYDFKKFMVGVWSDMMLMVFGVFGYIVEFWNFYGFVGVMVEKFVVFFMNFDVKIVCVMFEVFFKIFGVVIDWQFFEYL